MPKFLANLDLNKNELQNAVVQPLGTPPSTATAVEGQIYYDNTNGDQKIYVFNGTSWVAVGEGAGGTFNNFTVSDGTDTRIVNDGETFTISGGTGITSNETGSDTAPTIEVSITNGGVGTTQLADNAVTTAKITNANVTTAKIADANVTTAKIANDNVTYAKLQNVAANSILGNNTGSAANAIELTAAQVRTLISVAENANNYSHPNHSGQVTSSGDGATELATTAVTAQTDLGNNFASGDSFIVYDTSATGLREGTVGNLQNYMQSNLTFTTNTDEDVSNANLLAALAALQSSGGDTDENITIGTDSGDTIVITGNLQVNGTTTTVNSTTVDLNDHNIRLDSGNTTAAVVNGAGITLDGGTGTDATFTYSTTGPQFELKLGAAYEDLQVAGLKASSITLGGTAISATAAELNQLDDVSVGGTATGDIVTIDGTQTLTNKSIAASQINSGTIANARLDQQLQDVAGLAVDNGNFIVGNGTNFVAESGSTARASLGLTYATEAQAKAGASTGTVLSPATLADRMVVSTVDVSNATFTAQSGTYYAAVNHALGTEDIIVQLFDATTKATVYADIERKNFAGTNSTNDIRIGFAAIPDNDVEVVITSVAGAQAKTASYS